MFFNNKRININNFQKYAQLYLDDYSNKDIIYEKINDRWEVIATYNDKTSNLEQVSFVNGIWTIKGGKHVDNVVNQIIKNMTELIVKKNKDLTVKPQHIRDNLFVFIKSTIVNPNFDSQTKDNLTTPVAKFGSKCTFSKQFFNKLYSSKLTENVIELSNLYLNKNLKKTDGKKEINLEVFQNLMMRFGLVQINHLNVILTEGDSAKSMAIAGLSVVGRKI